MLGHRIDGTQAHYVRIPHADTSLYAVPPGTDEASLVMLSDLKPAAAPCSEPDRGLAITHWFCFDRIVAAYDDAARAIGAQRPRVIIQT